MDLKATLKINKKIMALIASKYPDEFPTGYTTLDFRYYTHLRKDIENAERHLSYTTEK